MRTLIVLSARSGSGDGFQDDLPLDLDVTGPVVLDASRLGICHPMFLIRMRLFLDWHLAHGHDVSLRPPADPAVAQRLADMGVVADLPSDVIGAMATPGADAGALFPIRRLKTSNDVEDASAAATEVLHEQAPALAAWGDPVYMAVSELCGNALQHGRHELGAYVAADRVTGDQRVFRLGVVDLGIGIPEHIRNRHPDWHDDTAAISSALVRGVTGTKDPQRGNGFAEVFDEALDRLLVRTLSAVNVDIRSGAGRVVVDLVDGRMTGDRGTVGRSRRGTWITYTVTTI